MPAMTIEQLYAFLAEHFPQAAELDVRIEELGERSIRVRVPTQDRHLRPGGTVSGPTLVWLADLGFYLLLMGAIGGVTQAVTTNLSINFLRRPTPGDLIGEGRLLRAGKTLAVGDFTIRSDGEDEPVAHVTLTYALPAKRDS